MQSVLTVSAKDRRRSGAWHWGLKGLQRSYSVLLFVMLWELLGRVMHNPLFLPPFTDVLQVLVRLALSGELLTHVMVSSYRALVGFAAATLIGVPLGLAMGWYGQWERFWSPLISLSYPVPKIGLIPLFILWLGIGDTSKIVMIVTGAAFPIILNTYSGVKGTPLHLVWSARSLGASGTEVLWRVVFPHALPHVFTGLRLAMGISWILLFAAEMVAAQSGLGWLILFAERMLDTETVFAALVSIAILGFLFDWVVHLLSQRFCSWYSARVV